MVSIFPESAPFPDTMDTMSEFQNPWPAPLATRPLSATVTIPGSKSLSNRYLILAAMGRRPVTLVGLLRSRDTDLMMGALRSLGVERRPVTLVGLLRSRDTDLMMGALRSLGVEFQVDSDDETTVHVIPPASGRFTGDVDVYCGLAGTVMRFVPGLAMFADFQVDSDDETTVHVIPPASGRFTGDVDVYCGLAGTVMRFVPGLAMFADGPVRFDGDAQAYARPMKPVLEGLEQLGARIEYHGEPGRLPFTLTPPAASDGTGAPAHTVSIHRIPRGAGATAVHADPARGIRRDGRAGAYGVHRRVRILPIHLRPAADWCAPARRIGTAAHRRPSAESSAYPYDGRRSAVGRCRRGRG